MDDIAQGLLDGMDDEGFCDCLLAILQSPSSRGLALLYEEWVLLRLRKIKEHAAHIYFGHFLSPLRLAFPGHVYPPDITAAMHSVTSQPQAAEGDVLPEVFAASIEDVLLNGLPKAHDTGWYSLAPHYKIRQGEMTIVTGIASHFKSSFVHSLAINLARLHGWNFALFNPEHHPLGSLGGWLIHAYTGQPQDALSDADRDQATAWVTDHFHMIVPPDEVQPTLPWLLAVARVQKQRYGLEGLIIDPWNEVEHCYEADRETQYISLCLSQVRRFARAHNIHVWIVAHPTKMQKAVSGKYAGQYPPPTPYDIAGSSNWYNKADNCVSLWRDALQDSPLVEVHIQKVRNRAVGHVGKVDLRFDGQRFHDLGPMSTPHWSDKD
jgi:twinkle protein